MTHSALDVLDLGQDVQVEAVRLPSAAVPPVHEVTEGQDQAQHLHHALPVPQSLGGEPRGGDIVMLDKPSENTDVTTSNSNHYRPLVIVDQLLVHNDNECLIYRVV